MPLPAAALQFALGHPIVASVATGCSSPREVAENTALMTMPIPDAFWEELKVRRLIRLETPIG
ncbi:hypothetical protein GCM10010869_15340 [Mesorhizobium tianshanense]|nr:hypothetical protein GCM10010869_15340 [Mesorhizobium tianshanense]